MHTSSPNSSESSPPSSSPTPPKGRTLRQILHASSVLSGVLVVIAAGIIGPLLTGFFGRIIENLGHPDIWITLLVSIALALSIAFRLKEVSLGARLAVMTLTISGMITGILSGVTNITLMFMFSAVFWALGLVLSGK